MIVLGIDTSCDDTAIGIVADGVKIKANIIASQHTFHERYGGIVPSLASRQHLRIINPLLNIALEQSGLALSAVDAIAVSCDQGLAPSLAVGVSVAKAIAMAENKPLIGVHHVEGHVYSNILAYPNEVTYPFLCLTVAGGHTMILLARQFGVYELLGHCRDDSAGEAYDKVARRLGLSYPGGPVIDQIAPKGNPTAFNFPRPLIKSSDLEFSFSGLKSAVNRAVEGYQERALEVPVADIAASFQAAVVDVLVSKTLQSIRSTGVRTLTVAGGVAANRELRSRLVAETQNHDIALFIPPRDLCIDNGAMIAGVGYHHLIRGERADMKLDYRPNAPLGALGVKYRHLTKYK